MNGSWYALLLAQSLLLLAESDRAERFVNGFRQGNPLPPVAQFLPMAVLVLATLTVFYIYQLITLMRERSRVRSDRRLFHELCRLHRLDGTSVRALEQLIRAAKLEQAPSIFLRPDLFAAIEPVPASDRQMQLLARLKDKLFPV
jgi:hypothetical protein